MNENDEEMKRRAFKGFWLASMVVAFIVGSVFSNEIVEVMRGFAQFFQK
jgi:hypothetical protein